MPSFVHASSIDALLAHDAVWLNHGRLALWSVSNDLLGSVAGPHFDDDDATGVTALWSTVSTRFAAAYDVVLDLRRLESVSRGAFARLHDFACAQLRGLRRVALLVDEDTAGGATVVGLFDLHPPHFAWRACTAPHDAAHWLERHEVAPTLDAVEALLSAHHEPSMERLRVLLRAAPGATELELASSLTCSRRSVQRLLEAHGTTFLELRARVRVELAQELLRDPSAKLDAIAAAVGCTDRRTLNRLFKRLTGESPANFRRRVGVGAPARVA
ncbi:MAG: helix-turn-helix transcriptional regulator [Myxococcota bacterium]